MAAGLHPDELGEIMRSLRSASRNGKPTSKAKEGGKGLLIRGGRRGEKRGFTYKGKGDRRTYKATEGTRGRRGRKGRGREFPAKCKKGRPYSITITERRVPELIPVLGR